MHLGQLLRILKFFRGGEDPLFENLKILFHNIIECLYITLDTKFHPSRSIIEEFEKKFLGGRAPILKIFSFLEILFHDIIECLYITLETKFIESRSNIEDFENFWGGEDPNFENFDFF